MTDYTYIQLLNKTLEYYFKEEYEAGYKFLNKHMESVKGNKAQLYNFLYTLACKAGQPEKAIELLREAVYDNEYWYAAQYLKEDEDLDPLRDYDDFPEIIEVCEKREQKAKSEARPKLKVYMPEDGTSDSKLPLFISLHGNQSNIEIAEDYWKSIVKENKILALPQSSQIEFHKAYVWDDIELGVKELKHHYNNLMNNYDIDSDQIILGGFSAGARVIIKAVTTEVIKPAGLVLMAPWLPEINEEEEFFTKLKDFNIKPYVLCGKEDGDCLEYCSTLFDRLNESGTDYKYDLIKGLDHDYPADFAESLKKAIEYIEE